MSPMNDLPPDSRPLPPSDPEPTPTQAIPAQQAADQPVGPPVGPPVGSPVGPPVGPPADKQRLRDRLWSFRALIAVALASVIVGGLGGAALASVADNGNDGRRGPGQFNRGGGFGGPGMMNRGPRNGRQNGQQGFDRRGTGPRQFGQDDAPDGQPSGPPTPVVPTPTS